MTKIPEEILLDLKVDEATIMKQLLDIEAKTKEVDKLVEKTGKKSRETWMLAVGVAQSSWTLFETIISTSGVVVTDFLRTAISSAFSAIAIMKPILAAEAVTPGMQALAAIGFFQIGLALQAAYEAEREQVSISVLISGYERSLSSTNSWIRSLMSFGKNL